MTKLFNVFIAFSFISTHILTKRMTPTVYTVPLHFSHFNSHPHEEDDRRQEVIDYVINISTHILTKRMTLCVYTTICNIGISTHILTKRMTDVLEYWFHAFHISTHILTKRMTRTVSSLRQPTTFQLTSSRRG